MSDINLKSRVLVEAEVLPDVNYIQDVQIEESKVIDGRDVVDDYDDEGVRYLIRETFWVHADRVGERVISPNDKSMLKKILHEESGVLGNVLRKLNWHISCKKELLRWIKNHQLEDDLMIAREDLIDKSESVIRGALDVNDVKAAQFVLKTAGKKRGWSEHEKSEGDVRNVYGFIDEVTGGDVTKMSDEELVKSLEESIRNR